MKSKWWFLSHFNLTSGTRNGHYRLRDKGSRAFRPSFDYTDTSSDESEPADITYPSSSSSSEFEFTIRDKPVSELASGHGEDDATIYIKPQNVIPWVYFTLYFIFYLCACLFSAETSFISKIGSYFSNFFWNHSALFKWPNQMFRML